jgi:fatty-acyl-CoA synthase
MLSHGAVCSNIAGILRAADITADDTVLSWLPLYHDMGLIGLLALPMTVGMRFVLADTRLFLEGPGRWMRWMSEFRATISAAPNFAYALAARALRNCHDLDLSQWRLAINGAEQIDPAAVSAFVEAGRTQGLRSTAPFCVYGLAESTLAVTFPPPETGLRTVSIERGSLERDGKAVLADGEQSLPLVRLGTAIDGIEMRLTDPDGQVQTGVGSVGEVEVRGTSLMSGYFRDPIAGFGVLRDGWLRTGDLGFLAGRDLVICGRTKDIIVIGGRNILPEDVERAAAAVSGVRKGNVVAFGVGAGARESLIVVAETVGDSTNGLTQEIARRVRHRVGISPADIVLVPRGRLPKTSSGKLQRSLCRHRYVSNELAESQ